MCGPGVDGPTAAHAGQQHALAAAQPWAARAMAWMRRRSAGEPFTADDVVAAVGLPTGELRQNANGAVGAVIRTAYAAGVIVPLGYVPSTRPESHGRPIRLWQRVTDELW